MPQPDPAQPADELILAALERAVRHDPIGQRAVPVWSVHDHLGLRRRSRAARHAGDRLRALSAERLVVEGSRHGVSTWAPTEAGRARLSEAARAGGQAPALPESPQHRTWRLARLLAGQELDRFHDELREQLKRALRLLEADPPARSDAWLELAEQLARACRRFASASYCLREWAEPDDAHADVDERLDAGDEALDERERARRRARRTGRRNTRLWGDLAGEL
ncbi:MAG TPA: hypothetical protein VGY13_06965 [Solirubrobacteraceae bacterium]|jgi:hypothetical protein|nr:hypothetical protein [Solirubrobacteraceae bacterium]